MRKLIVVAVLLAACGDSATTTATTTLTTSTATSVGVTSTANGAPDDPIYTAAVQALSNPSEFVFATLATDMRASGDPSWIPYLVDMSRLTGAEDVVARIRGALEDLTGIEAPPDTRTLSAFYGSWLYDNPVDAGERYVAWKAELYGLIDPSFLSFIAQIDDPVVASRVQWGGVRRGGIPELNDQPTLAASEAAYMQDDELTFGAVVNGQARSYPHRILDHHELANDSLGGEPVALANCTLCRTGILFSRRVDGEVLDFQTSGLLINSNKIMVDLQSESLWEQLTGVAIAGPMEGTVLDRYFLTVTTWADWVAQHPDSDVVSIPDSGPYSYQPGDAYRDYYGSDVIWFPTFAVSDVFAAKTEVGTLDLGDVQLAVDIAALSAAGAQRIDVGVHSVVAVPTGPGARFYDATGEGDLGDLGAAIVTEESLTLPGGRNLRRIQSGQSFWFAWYGNFPQTSWWPDN